LHVPSRRPWESAVRSADQEGLIQVAHRDQRHMITIVGKWGAAEEKPAVRHRDASFSYDCREPGLSRADAPFAGMRVGRRAVLQCLPPLTAWRWRFGSAHSLRVVPRSQDPLWAWVVVWHTCNMRRVSCTPLCTLSTWNCAGPSSSFASPLPLRKRRRRTWAALPAFVFSSIPVLHRPSALLVNRCTHSLLDEQATWQTGGSCHAQAQVWSSKLLQKQWQHCSMKVQWSGHRRRSTQLNLQGWVAALQVELQQCSPFRGCDGLVPTSYIHCGKLQRST